MMKNTNTLLLVLLFHQVESMQESTIQQFKTMKDQAPFTRQYYSPLASFAARSVLDCAANCVQHTCCVALFVQQSSGKFNCSLFDIAFGDTFLKQESTSIYMYRTPLQG